MTFSYMFFLFISDASVLNLLHLVKISAVYLSLQKIWQFLYCRNSVMEKIGEKKNLGLERTFHATLGGERVKV